MASKRLILLDTNMLMAVSQMKLDVFSRMQEAVTFPYELAIVEGTIGELELLSKEGKVVDRTAAKVGLGLIKAKGLKTLDSDAPTVDDALVQLANQGALVATQDRGLQRRLSTYIYVRQKKYLKIKA